jgi:hypothetical protein
MNTRFSLAFSASVVAIAAWACIGCGTAPGTDASADDRQGIHASGTTYSWNKGANAGGGFANVGAVDPLQEGRAAAGGDVWGTHTTVNGGAVWTPRMWGAEGIGDIYTRAMAFSRKTPGTVYVGIGTLKGGGGYFGVIDGWQLERRNSRFGFGTTQSDNPAATQPRAVGQLIQVDLDATTGTEYIYALTHQGLAVSTDAGTTFDVLGPAGNALTNVQDMAWKALVIVDSNTLLAASYHTSLTDGSRVWRITGIRGTPAQATITPITAAPSVVEDLRNVGGTIFAACGPYGVQRVTSAGSVWTPIGGSTFDATHVSSVDGLGSTMYAGTAIFPRGSAKPIAKSTDGGTTWSWVTGSSHVSNILLGTSTSWWLGESDQGVEIDGNSYVVSQLMVDPFNANVVYSFGRSGAWVTNNGGTLWQPAMVGLNGTEATHVRVDPGDVVVTDDTDWKGESSSDHFTTCTREMSPGTFGATKKSVTVGGHTYTVKTGKPADITKDGVSIADDYFRGALVNFSDIAVDSAGYVYIAQYGGGILVGTP